MSTIAEYFDRIYVINLASRLDRKREMAEQLARLGLALTHPAVRLFPAIRPAEAGQFPSIGGRGCFLSHMEVLREAESAGHRRIAIFEDDLNFSKDIVRRQERLVAGLATRQWGIFYGGYYGVDPQPADSYGLAQLPSDQAVLCTHFVCVQGFSTINRLRALLETFSSRPAGHPQGGPMQIDGAYTWFRRLNPEEITLLAVPPLGYQRSSRTDNHALSWFDKLPLARNAVAVLRRLKNATRYLER